MKHRNAIEKFILPKIKNPSQVQKFQDSEESHKTLNNTSALAILRLKPQDDEVNVKNNTVILNECEESHQTLNNKSDFAILRLQAQDDKHRHSEAATFLCRRITTGRKKSFAALKKTIAFTLAEVLITLVIIGVIAAITVPALLISTSNQEYVTAYKKMYSELCQFHTRLKTDNGGYFDNLFSDEEKTLETFSKYFAAGHICRKGVTDDQCFPTYSHQTVQASSPDYTLNNAVSFIFADGAALVFQCFSADCTDTTELTKPIGCVRVRADVNGFRKPNRVGKDIHDFYITEDKIIPRGDPLTTTSLDNESGWAEGYKIITTGKL